MHIDFAHPRKEHTTMQGVADNWQAIWSTRFGTDGKRYLYRRLFQPDGG